MAIKYLTLNEMVHLTGAILAEGSPARAAIARQPLLAPLLSVLDAAHREVLRAMPKPDDPRLKQIMVEAAAVDAVFDALASGVYLLLTALSQVNANAASYLEIRDALLPEGVAGATQITYEGEAGFAARVRARLTPALEEQLGQVSAGRRSLREVVMEWLDAGDRIGRLEQQRQTQGAGADAPTPARVHAARLQWIRAVNGLRGVADLGALSDADRQSIFGAIDAAEVKADQRVVRRQPAELETNVAQEIEAGAAPNT